MTDIRANRMVGERNHFEVRSSDPTTTQEGEAWIRADIAPDTAQIGTLRFDSGGSILDIPIYLNGTSDSNISEALRVKVNNDIGFIPTLPANQATFPELRFQHNDGVTAFHDVPQLADAFFDIQNLSTNSPVTEGNNLTATYSIENTGGQDGTQTIELLDISGSVVDSSSETVAEGAVETGKQLTWATTSGDAGSGDITVESQDDAATATVDIQQASAIPDSVVSRPDDTETASNTAVSGLVIETKTEWPSIGAEISNNTSGATEAYLKTDSGSLIDSTDISNLSAGDAFTFESVNLDANTKYRIILDANGSSYTPGLNSNASGNYPFTSPDVDITGRIFGSGNVSTNAPIGVNNIGDVGFN